MAGFEPSTRARNLRRLADETYDVLVVGGGITGAGVAREAALRGLTVALVEARDFASGTSSRSSKLIHGGLRYLEQGEIGLVREAATERKILRRIAPHLTTPAPMLVPVYGRTSAGVYKLRVGLTLYDKLAAVPTGERHRTLTRDETIAAEPRLARERLQGAAVYPEYVTDDARLVLDTVKAASHAGAVTVNYTRVTALGRSGELRIAELCDDESGTTFTAGGRVVVNAAGPWVDTIRLLDETGCRSGLHLTKGIHLVFRREDLPCEHCVVMRARDGRPVFTLPRGRYVYVGTTDTTYEGPLDEPPVNAEDARYLFEALNRSFTDLRLGPEHVTGAWAGVRPLVQEEGKGPSEISRKDEITVSAGGVVTVAGGKLTTYRRMAERVVATAASLLHRSIAPSDGDRRPLAGGEGEWDGDAVAPAEPHDSSRACASGSMRAPKAPEVPAETWARLVGIHGSDAPEVLRAGDFEGSLAPLAADVPLCAAEVMHAVRHEMARTLADVLERRSRLALFSSAAARAVAPAAARIVATELGWDALRLRTELETFEQRTAARLAWRDTPVDERNRRAGEP